MANLLIYILLFFFTMFMIFRLYYSRSSTSTKNLPPSPPRLPIIGNLHQLGPLIHRSFFSLSQRYGGPLMLLHLGSVPTLVVSSTEAAREILQTHDLNFASKPNLKLYKKLFYNAKEISEAPYGEYWRQAKKMIVLHFLSKKMVRTYSGIRDQEISIVVDEIEKLCMCKKVVKLMDLFFKLSNAVSCRAAFGRKYNEGETGGKFVAVLEEFLPVLTHFYFADSIPWLGWIDRISGANGRVEKVAKEFDEFFEEVIKERVTKKEADDEVGEDHVEPFVDALLRIEKDGVTGISFDRDSVKALLADSYLAGTDNSWTLAEWAIAELLANPSVLKKLQEEVRTIVNGKKHITNEDVEKMKYLKAVIMETIRIHPPVPVTPPRVATEDVKIMGFDIAKGTWVYFNLWEIGRDPEVWERPDEFVPERFVGVLVDHLKNDFKFISFGGGRRKCPGGAFAMALVENLLANLLSKFDWALPDGIEGVNMDETCGLTCQKKIPLLAFAKPISS